MQLAKDGYLDEMGVKLLGTDAEAIDKAEDRQMFRDTMVKINQPVVPSDIAYTVDHAKEIASDIGYPVIIRPAFTLGGAGGGVAYNEHELEVIAKNGLLLSPITQVLVKDTSQAGKRCASEHLKFLVSKRYGRGDNNAVACMNTDRVKVFH